jgi:hypothetical protein
LDEADAFIFVVVDGCCFMFAEVDALMFVAEADPFMLVVLDA